jgi:hypothetical protein
VKGEQERKQEEAEGIAGLKTAKDWKYMAGPFGSRDSRIKDYRNRIG